MTKACVIFKGECSRFVLLATFKSNAPLIRLYANQFYHLSRNLRPLHYILLRSFTSQSTIDMKKSYGIL